MAMNIKALTRVLESSSSILVYNLETTRTYNTDGAVFKVSWFAIVSVEDKIDSQRNKAVIYSL